MGIKGLTTYVERHSDQFFETLHLKDCFLVIDGNSLASQLYQNVCKSNSAFGGDYDAYADCIRHFFNTLGKCNVTPLILLDGGYEIKKLKTVKSRFQTRICNARRVNPVVQMKRSVFPLFLAVVFIEVMAEMKLKVVQCAFEADHEIAAVARTLKCPVLSYDSDFYIYDVVYLPFDKLSLETIEIELPNGGKCYALECEVYKVENFLSWFGGLEKSVLPLMATVLGNDYIEKKVFQNFFAQIKHPKSHSSSDTQRHIVGLLTWLRGKTLYGAMAMILACIKQHDRQKVLEQLNKSVRNYSRTSTVLPLLCPGVSADELSADVACFVTGDADGELVGALNKEHLQNVLDKCPVDKPPAEEVIFDALPQWFRENFYKALLPPSILNMITLGFYFCQPQVEDYSLSHSHELSTTFLPVMLELVTGREESPSELTVVFRSKNAEMRKVVLSSIEPMRCHDPYPRLEDLPNISSDVRGSVILETAGLGDKYKTLRERVPDTWKLFVVAVVFWAQRTTHLRSSLPSLISAILLTAASLKVVDGVVGYFNTRKSFLKHHGSKLKKIERSVTSNQTLSVNGTGLEGNGSDKNIEQLFYNENCTVSDALKNVSEPDCFLFAGTFVQFRNVDESVKCNPKLYNTTLVHALAQFQSCLLHIMHLNALLNFPFEQCKISSFFSGTAVYNLYVNFQKRTNLNSHIVQLFGQSASVLRLFFSLQNVVTLCLPGLVANAKTNKKRRKRKSHKIKNLEDCYKDASDESVNEDVLVDINNKFSALSHQ